VVLLLLAGLRVLSLHLQWEGEHSLPETVAEGELVVTAKQRVEGRKNLVLSV
jgi:hypothetical protein